MTPSKSLRFSNWLVSAIAVAAMMTPSIKATALPIAVDGDDSDWVGAAPSVLHDTVIRETEWIYTGESGDSRNDPGAASPNFDITEFRVSTDGTFLYFLIRLDDIINTDEPHIAIALDIDRSNSDGNGLSFLAHGGGTTWSGPERHPEYLLSIHNTTLGITAVEFFHDAGAGSWYNPNVVDNTAFISAANDIVEVRVRLSDFGIGACDTVGFTVAAYDNGSEGLPIVTGPNVPAWNNLNPDTTVDYPTQDALDAVGGTMGSSENAWTRAFGGGTSMTAATLQVIPIAALSTTLEVTTLADVDNGDYCPNDLSLREAINLANQSVTHSTIRFSPLLDAGTITLSSPLPPIVTPVTIDASSALCTPNVYIDGSGAGVGTHGIYLAAGSEGSTISGLRIINFDGDGIRVESSDNRILCCQIGTTGAATAANGGWGVQVVGDASNNQIGIDGFGNLISGNSQGGILVDGPLTDRISIVGNRIGTNAGGTGAISNGNATTHLGGIRIINGSSRGIVGGDTASERNQISGNRGSGITLDSTVFDYAITGNYIGSNAGGFGTIPNTSVGVAPAHGISVAGADIWIGGGNVGEGNLIVGNRFSGIYVTGATGTRIMGNDIGVDVVGLANRPNNRDGIHLDLGSTDSVVINNVIASTFGPSIHISSSAGGNNLFQGNFIGVNRFLTGSLSTREGMLIQTGNQIIGGTALGQGNTFGNATYNPILIMGTPAPTGIPIRGNRFLSNNPGTAIFLGRNQVYTNDPLDADIGANDLQNNPIPNEVFVGDTVITGRLSSKSSRNYEIDIYVSDTHDSAYRGYGSVVGTVSVNTNPSGDAVFSYSLPVGSFPAGALGSHFFSMLATDMTTNETSVLSPVVQPKPNPTVAITATGTTPTSANSIGYDVQFSEPMRNFNAAMLGIDTSSIGVVVDSVTSRFGNSALFPGNRGLVYPPNASLQGLVGFTFEGWVKNPPPSQKVVLFQSSSGNNGYRITLDNNRLYFVVGSTATLLSINPALPDEWFHLAVTYDGSTLAKAYINGNLYRTATLTLPSVGVPDGVAHIGCGFTTFGTVGDFLTGSIDEVRVWNAALSDLQIFNQWNTIITVLPPSLVAYWPMNDNLNERLGNAVPASIPGLGVTPPSITSDSVNTTDYFHVTLDVTSIAEDTVALTIPGGSAARDLYLHPVDATPIVAPSYLVDHVGPIPSITPLASDPYFDPIPALTFTFDEPTTGVTHAGLLLDFNGTGNILTGTESINTINPTTFELADLGALIVTPGIYTLTVSPGTTTDLLGNPQTASTSYTFFYRMNALIVDTLDDIDNGNYSPGDFALREAMLLANDRPVSSTIHFANSITTGTISLVAALPAISQQMLIDGNPVTCDPTIRIDGAIAGALVDGFHIVSGGEGSTLRGLVITNFDGHGINIQAANNAIECNYIGTDGILPQPNRIAGIGLSGAAADNRIGGSVLGNVIAGNTGRGIAILGAGVDRTIVQGNHIGTNPLGTAAIPNGTDLAGIGGIQIDGPNSGGLIGGSLPGEGNVISGNSGNGIETNNTTSGYVFRGNRIGTTADGLSALPNTLLFADNGNGILLFGTNHQLGGLNTGEGNLISGNEGRGLWLNAASGVRVQGNTIGTDVLGANPVPNNATAAVYITTASANNIISGNVIAGNTGSGIWVVSTAGANNQILGNFIGTDTSGTRDLGNGGSGVRTQRSLTLIGGVGPGEGNTIAFNRLDGIGLFSNPNGVRIRGNSFYQNGRLAIDLNENEVTLNDPLDPDAGSNRLQNFPEIDPVYPGDNVITGTFNSTPSVDHFIDLYSDAVRDLSHYGEGRYIGSTTVTTDTSGDASFSFTLPLTTFPTGAVSGTFFSSTATRISNDDTSEMSRSQQVGESPFPLQITRLDPNPTTAPQVSWQADFSEPVAPITLANFTLVTSGTLAGSALVDARGAFDEGLTFNNSILRYPSNPAYNMPTGFTLEAWIQPNTTATTRSIIDYRTGAAGFSFRQSNQKLSLVINNTTTFLTNAVLLPLGELRHVAVVFNGSDTASFYIDGELVETVTAGPTLMASHAGQIAVGSLVADTAATRYDGFMDDVRIWNTQRTSTEIRDSRTSPLVGTEANLVAYWPFDGSFEQVVTGSINTVLINPGPFQVSPVYSDTCTIIADSGFGEGFLGLNITSAESTISESHHPLSGLPVIGEIYTLDRTPPTATIIAAIPNPRFDAVTTMTIVFSEPIINFDPSDLTLTRNGGPNLLNGSETIVQIDPLTYEVGSIAYAYVESGTYTLTVLQSDIQDVATNGLFAPASSSHFFYSLALQVDDLADIDNGDYSLGDLTLREAITLSNASPTSNSITFANTITSGTITLVAPLPPITSPATIDATLVDCGPGIIVDGAGLTTNGFEITPIGSPSRIAGLVIINFDGAGIQVEGQDNVLTCNFIGTDGDNDFGNTGPGILLLGAARTLVGEPGEGNLISGNGAQPILVDAASEDTEIYSNTIGLSLDASLAISNALALQVDGPRTIIGAVGGENTITNSGADGILLSSASADGFQIRNNTIFVSVGNGIAVSAGLTVGTISENDISFSGLNGIEINGAENILVAQNVITSNNANGITLTGAAEHNLLLGNFIGTNRVADRNIGNQQAGVYMTGTASHNRVGAFGTQRSVISGNALSGVDIDAGSNNVIEGSLIGVNPTATGALANFQDGVSIRQSTTNNTVGSLVLDSGNVIAGNRRHGVYIELAELNLVIGNDIGTTGTLQISNAGHGVAIAANNNTVGNSFVNAGNRIGTNSLDGVNFSGSASRNLVSHNEIFNNRRRGVAVESGDSNRIVANRIYGNSQLGIDLFPIGVTPNDPSDADTGANSLFNFPEIGLTRESSGGVNVNYHGLANRPVLIQVFRVLSPDPSGHGEGDLFVGEAMINTDAAGNATALVTVFPSQLEGEYYSATATDLVTESTSEFSAVYEVLKPNEAPTDIILSNNLHPENDPPNTFIGTLTSIDSDTSDSHVYTLISSTDPGITLVGDQIVAAVTYDYEMNPGPFTIVVRSTDLEGEWLERTFQIFILDINDPPTNILLSNNLLYENTPPIAVIGTLTTVDQDAIDTHTYTLLSTTHPDLGLVGDQVVANASFNFEAGPTTITLVIQTADDAPTTHVVSFDIQILDRNDRPTDILVIAPNTPNNCNNTMTNPVVYENIDTAGTVVAGLCTVDEDFDQTHSYELLYDESNAFEIVGSVIRLVYPNRVDFEKDNLIDLYVRSTDNGDPRLSVTKAIRVIVLDIPERPEIVRNEPLTVELNTGYAKLNSSRLQLADPDSTAYQMGFIVTSPPQQGYLARYDLSTTTPISMFTQEDINLERVFYVHTTPSFNRIDTFQFMYHDETIAGPFGPETFVIQTLRKNSPPTVFNNGANIASNSLLTIAAPQLRLQDAEQEYKDLSFIIHSEPLNGRLIVSGKRVRDGGFFTMEDVVFGRVIYRRDDPNINFDRFTFRFTDNVIPEAIPNSVALPYETFVITMDSLVVSAPFWCGPVPQGITIRPGDAPVLTSGILALCDNEQDPEKLVYTITQLPQYGELNFAVHEKNFKYALTTNATFTQKDVDDGRITYAHYGSLAPTDFFEYSFTDGVTAPITGQVFPISVVPALAADEVWMKYE